MGQGRPTSRARLAVIGRARARFGAAVSAFDADGDGKLDLYLASAVAGPKGVRDVLLHQQGRRPVRGWVGRVRAAERSRQHRRRRG